MYVYMYVGRYVCILPFFIYTTNAVANQVFLNVGENSSLENGLLQSNITINPKYGLDINRIYLSYIWPQLFFSNLA